MDKFYSVMKNKLKLVMAAMMIASCSQGLGQNLNKGLIAYYPFNGNANDESGSIYDGLVGGGNFNFGNDRFEKENESIALANDNSLRINIEKLEINSGNNFSASLWFKPKEQLSSYNQIVVLSGGPGCNTWMSEMNYVGGVFRLVTGMHCARTVSVPDYSVADNTWHHLVVNFKDRNRNVYINNKLIDSTFISEAVATSQIITYMYIGGDRRSALFNGNIDDVRLYNRALSEAEVTSLYEGESKRPTPEVPSETVYSTERIAPPGFSMMSIPFSYRGNIVDALFGNLSDVVIYSYDHNSGWLINEYSEDFEEWTIPNHIMPAGTAFWILNNTSSHKKITFKGETPINWRPSIGGVE
jgi:hypothetical protein